MTKEIAKPAATEPKDVKMGESSTAAAAKKDVKDPKKKDDDDELSEEDQKLKDELEMLVVRLQESNTSLHKPALESLRTLIRTSTSSMTSVPKPLKFLRPHYYELQAVYEKWPKSENKLFLADIISVLAMSYDDGKRDCLKYRFLGASEPVGSWGHEYVRHLASELIVEYNARAETGDASDATPKDVTPQTPTSDLIKLALEIVPFCLKHNAEADACDLLLELESLHKLPEFVDKDTFGRVCLYIVSMVPYVAPPDDLAILKTARSIYRAQGEWTRSILISLRINDLELVKEDYESCEDPLTKKQLAFICARQQVFFETGDETITEILNNTKLSENFMALARDLDVVEAKTPEDIYKTHLENSRHGSSAANVDSARQNLASTFVNAFVNIGFGSDKLMMNSEDASNSWIYKNKDLGMMSAAASLGAILLWDVEVGSSPHQTLEKKAIHEQLLWKVQAEIPAGPLMIAPNTLNIVSLEPSNDF
ncbi:proteasome regulatory particle base subunit [Rhizoclosmatium sp. JEL0117]|nr:proteasome regulatory particle base subunit [Rhizoclosmatium sp. JEL0117]